MSYGPPSKSIYDTLDDIFGRHTRPVGVSENEWSAYRDGQMAYANDAPPAVPMAFCCGTLPRFWVAGHRMSPVPAIGGAA